MGLGDFERRLSGTGTSFRGARISDVVVELRFSTGAVIVIFGDFSRPSTLRLTSFSSDDLREWEDGADDDDGDSLSKLSELLCLLISCILRYRSASESVL